MKKFIGSIITILLFLSILTSFQTGESIETFDKVLYVGGNEPENYSSIQSAIDNASDGDTIFVYNGIYNENIIVNKTIDLIGENKENTIINGYINEIYENFLIAFYILADQVNLSNFTITNSIFEYDLVDSSIYGVGILIKANKTTIENNIIKDNTFGISLDNSFSNKIISNILMDNYIQINLLGSSENIIENNNITNLNLNPNNFLHLNENIGISLDIASNNTIVNNSISSISGTAIKLSYLCQNNLLYYNNLIKNAENANDSGNNSWDNDLYGNYWDDYNEIDKNNDGIGDISYKIPNGNNVDRYPLMMSYDGTFRLKEFYVDLSSVITMLIVGMILVIIFLIPIAYFWNKKTK